MSEVAGEALSKSVRMATTDCYLLNLCLHELREWNDIELGVSPDEAVIARWNLINRPFLPLVISKLTEIILLYTVNHELEGAIGDFFSTN